MKYIRTKDGIYDFEEQRGNIENRSEKSFLAMSNDYRGCTCYDYEEIVKEADTIEELCDEAVAVYPDGLHDNCSVMHIVDNNGFCEAVYGCLSVSADDLKKDYECWEVYGAIWTEWGLKYVAKMDEKGDLKLI